MSRSPISEPQPQTSAVGGPQPRSAVPCSLPQSRTRLHPYFVAVAALSPHSPSNAATPLVMDGGVDEDRSTQAVVAGAQVSTALVVANLAALTCHAEICVVAVPSKVTSVMATLIGLDVAPVTVQGAVDVVIRVVRVANRETDHRMLPACALELNGCVTLALLVEMASLFQLLPQLVLMRPPSPLVLLHATAFH